MTTTSHTTATEQPAEEGTSEGAQLKELLGEHVPISLIMDLAVPTGPDSKDILDTEGAPDGTWWVAP